MKATLAAIVHGEAGTGKSRVCGTTPAPRLILDAEGGSLFVAENLPSIAWNPRTEPVPVYDGTWNSVNVAVHDWATLVAAYNVLASGHHPFRSVVLDSLTEAQKRLIDNVSGTDQSTMQDWGIILRYLEDLVRKFRDLAKHPTNPMEAVVMTCLSHLRDDHIRPFLKGQLELTLPSFYDIVGYMTAEVSGATGVMEYKMLLQPQNNVVAKDRTSVITQAHGPLVANSNFTEWLALIQAYYDGIAAPIQPQTTPEV
jgi:hypothetical protein